MIGYRKLFCLALAMCSLSVYAWEKAGIGLHAMWGSDDVDYSRSIVPATTSVSADTMRIVGWRGEKVDSRIVAWAGSDANGVVCRVSNFSCGKQTIPSACAEIRPVLYTIADSAYRKKGPTVLVGDKLDNPGPINIEAKSVGTFWLSIDIPADATPGFYKANVKVTDRNGADIDLPLTLEVQNGVLPNAAQWKYHLDLWQHPSAVARALGLEMWSDDHFKALESHMKPLADAGQKVITATLNKDPWNHQCYDAYESMIKWKRNKDLSWSYDYSVFDRWVEMMMNLGINKMINCYSMVPWNNELEYFDAAADSVVTVKADPGSAEFEIMWEPFLVDFKKHLAKKGWLEITNIAMDERSPREMDAAATLLQRVAPEMGFAIADNHKSYRKYTMMRDVCVAIEQPADSADIVNRRENGYNTTFYICCNPNFPNTFTGSKPFEAEMLGWYGVAKGYDGMLRWAYNSWPADPQSDSRFGGWLSGDTYLVYPGWNSSVRFEKLVDGIRQAEKVRILRESGVDCSELEDALRMFVEKDVTNAKLPWHEIVENARKAIDNVSRKIK